MENKHIITALVSNKSGVLTRISGLFARRGYNIESLSVCKTHNPAMSRMTIVALGTNDEINQIVRQLDKCVDCHKTKIFRPEESVKRELLLIKVNLEPEKRPELNIGLKNRGKNKPRTAIAVMKLFEKAFLKLKGIMTLISRGLEQEAIVVWRSLHELECVISVLCKYDEKVIEEFETFDRFSEKRDDMDEQTQADYDARIKAFGINIKNNNEVDHFENYGWMGAIPGLELTKWNLNFRFLEDLAGLGEKYKEYQVACDASHMNAKILKWNKLRVLDFVVKRCFNSNLFIISNYTKFLTDNGARIDHNVVGKMISDLKNIIDIFLPRK